MSAQLAEALDVHPKLAGYIATRDRRLAKTKPWSPTPLADAFRQLLTGGSVVMGGRSTCGSSVDPTWIEFGLWGEVIRKARSLGYCIQERDIKQANGWATKAGGFWHEREYMLATGADA